MSTVLVLAGIMLPSLTSAVYFFIFLFLCTWWSLCRTFDTLIFSCMCVLMAIFSAGHIIVLYLYQFQFFQESIPPEDSLIRSDARRVEHRLKRRSVSSRLPSVWRPPGRSAMRTFRAPVPSLRRLRGARGVFV